jgi:hypothetical protein
MMLLLLLLLLCCSTNAFQPTVFQMGIAVQIKHSTRNVISPTILGKASGSLHTAGAAKKTKEQPLVLLQSVVGTRRDDGTDVVALVAPQQVRQGAEVVVDDSVCITKPIGLSWEEAAVLPYLAMTCVSALHASGITKEVS